MLVVITTNKFMSNFMEKLSKKSNGKRYAPEYKFEAVLLNITGAKSMEEIAKEKGVSVNSLITWKSEFFANAPKIFQEKKSDSGNLDKAREKEIERLGMEVQLLKKLLEHYRKIRDNNYSRPPDK